MRFYLLLLLGFLRVSASLGQDHYYRPGMSFIPGTYDFHLKDGNGLRGQLVRIDSTMYLIRTPEGREQSVPVKDIVRADLVGGTLRIGSHYPNGFPFRLLFFPTAIPVEKKRFHYQNSYGLFSRADFGLTRNWSVGLGFYTLRPPTFFTLATKLGTRLTPRIRVALNAQYIGMRAREQGLTQLGLVQGIATIGNEQRNFTLGLGTLFSVRGVASSGVVTIGYARKITPDLTFINQNNILLNQEIDPQYTFLTGMSSAGVRFNRRRHAFDLAALLPVYNVNRLVRTTVFPFLSYQVKFGK